MNWFLTYCDFYDLLANFLKKMIVDLAGQ